MQIKHLKKKEQKKKKGKERVWLLAITTPLGEGKPP
jgi:hypothetical protein